jgi:hypothetical protein
MQSDTHSKTLPTHNVIHSSTSLKIVFCRFNEFGKVKKANLEVASARYIAISHVWGKPEWRELPILDGERVLATREKVMFITNQLREIVGKEYFWMDILCVDQENEDARVAVTRHIPTIFRSALRTVLVRDGYGLSKCSMDLFGTTPMSEWKTVNEGSVVALRDHREKVHEGEAPSEGVLTRLWVLQEIILSDTVQVVICANVEPQKKGWHEAHEALEAKIFLDANTLGISWDIHNGSQNPQAAAKFEGAFFQEGTISRSPRNEVSKAPFAMDFDIHKLSTRLTSRPRDFILAIMPQYQFYTVPPNARIMSFSDLLDDCFSQLQASDPFSDIAPLFPTNSTASTDSTERVPIPQNLGDFVKLCRGPRLLPQASQTRVQVQLFGTDVDKATAVQLVLRCIRQSGPSATAEFLNSVTRYREKLQSMQYQSMLAKLILAGWPEMRNIENSASRLEAPDDTHRQLLQELEAFSGLQEIYCSLTSNNIESILQNDASETVVIENLVRMAALLNCEVGLSAFEWSLTTLTPVLVEFRGHPILALAPRYVICPENPSVFVVVQAQNNRNGSERFALLTLDKNSSSAGYTMCLFPSEVDFNIEI